MNLLGIHLKMLVGPQIPAMAPPNLSEALQSVEVSHSDQGRSGFQLTFQVGRGLRGLIDYSLLRNPLLQPFNRVILVIYFNVTRQTLMDGIITNQQLSPSDDPGASTLTITGEDVSVMMDLEERRQQHPWSDAEIVRTIISRYALYGLTLTLDHRSEQANQQPGTQEPPPTQAYATDLAYIQSLASRYGYVFYVKPGEIPGTNEAYWGPPIRSGQPQKALSVNMGPHTNVGSISFQYNALAPTRVAFIHNDREQRPIQQSSPERRQLARRAAEPRRTIILQDSGALNQQETGTSPQDRAQARFDESLNEVVTASGELDALRYGRILESRKLVGLRGAGESYDGTYYVKRVTHRIDIRKGEYKQNFSLTREGLGAQTPLVRV